MRDERRGAPVGSLASIALIVLAIVASATPVYAQTSREEAIAAQEAMRARDVAPSRPEPGERIVRLFENPVSSGIFPSFGGLIPGGGFNAGLAYTRYFADTNSWTVRGVYSVRQFGLVEGSLLLPGLWDDRLLVAARAAMNDGPRVEFFGLGPDSREDARAFYGLRQIDAGARAVLRPAPLLVLGGGAEFLRRTTGNNRGSGPSLEERFPPLDIQGFGETTRFGHYFGSVGLDWRNAAGYADRGGLYEATFRTHRSDDDRFSFERVDVDLVQHVPILRANWIVSLRARASTTLRGEGGEVPFYMLPRIGGADGVRGYNAYRFVDRHALLFSAEYRWTPGETLDMALFWDGGRVAPTRDELSLRGLRSSFGIGARFHTPSQTALRMELAVGTEGPRLIVAFSPSF